MYELICPSCKQAVRSPFVRIGAVVACTACQHKYTIEPALVRRRMINIPGGAAGMNQRFADIFAADPQSPAHEPATPVSSLADVTTTDEPAEQSMAESDIPARDPAPDRPAAWTGGDTTRVAGLDQFIGTLGKSQRRTIVLAAIAVMAFVVLVSVGLWSVFSEPPTPQDEPAAPRAISPAQPAAPATPPPLEAEWLEPEDWPADVPPATTASDDPVFAEATGWPAFDTLSITASPDAADTVRITADNPVDDSLESAAFAIYALNAEGKIIGWWRVVWPRPIQPGEQLDFLAHTPLSPPRRQQEVVQWRIIGIGEPPRTGP